MVGLVDVGLTENALAQGYDRLRGMQTERARRDAGNALATGNTQAAMSALGGVGDLQSVQALQANQDAQKEDARGLEQEERTRRLEFIGQAADAIYRAPPGERDAVWTQLRPVFQQMGFPDDLLLQLDNAPKTDANLQAVIAASGREIASPFANDVTIGASRLRPNAQTGQYEPVYTDPVEMEYRQAQIRSQDALAGQRQASGAAATARANRPSGGGSRGGGSAAPASGGGGGARPWERFRR
jgi:hypothetical protein